MPLYTIERRLPDLDVRLLGEHPSGPEQVKYSVTLEISIDALETLKRDIDQLTLRIEQSRGQDLHSVFARRRLVAQREFIHSVGWSIRKLQKDQEPLDEESGG